MEVGGGQAAAGGQGGMPGGAAGGQQGGQGQHAQAVCSRAGRSGGAAGGQGGMPGGAQAASRAARAACGGGGMPGFASKTDDEILADAKDYELKGYDVYQMMGSSLEAAKKVRAATNLILMGSIRGAGGGMPGSGENATAPTQSAHCRRSGGGR